MPLWIEIELSTLLSLIEMLHEKLVGVLEKSTTVEDPDALGYFDVAEHLTGLACVVCQTYMSTLCGAMRIQKNQALKVGARLSSGVTKAELLNHAANYWKHNNEWNNQPREGRQLQIVKAFESVGFPVDIDYPLSGLLVELSNPKPASIKELAHLLREWKVDLS